MRIGKYRILPKDSGDRVASVAQPIAKTIDKITGSNIQNCKSCKKRREYLNNLTK